MDELVKTVRDFFVRDVLYILGGGSSLLSLLIVTNTVNHVFQWINNFISPFLAAFFFLGFAYIFGYMIREVASMFNIAESRFGRAEKNMFVRLAYKGLYGKDLKIPTRRSRHEMWFRVHQKSLDLDYSYIRRLNHFKQVGATMGSNWLFSSILLTIYFFIMKTPLNSIYLVAVVGLFVISAFLLVIARVKNIEEMEAMVLLDKLFPNKDRKGPKQ